VKHKPALYPLERLHAELGGKIKENRNQAAKLVKQMKQVETVIRMLDPAFNILAIAPRRKYKSVAPFKKGHGFKAITDVLRASPEPLTSGEIANAYSTKRAIVSPRARLYAADRAFVAPAAPRNRCGTGQPRRKARQVAIAGNLTHHGRPSWVGRTAVSSTRGYG